MAGHIYRAHGRLASRSRRRISPRAATRAATSGASTAASRSRPRLRRSVVPKPYAHEDAVDPEEAFVASLSSCHMLTFVDLARRAGLVLDSYADEAEGEMVKNAEGRLWMARMTLRPKIAFSGARQAEPGELDRLHHAAHDLCFIANSVKTDIRVEPVVA